MESISGKKPLVRMWLHTGFLNIDSTKMSKSLKNFLTIREVFNKGISPLALRYYFLGSQYRMPMNFAWEVLLAAQSAYRKLKEFFSTLPDGGHVDENYYQKFMEVLADDLNTPEALAITWTLVRDENISPINKRATLLLMDQVLGLDLTNNEFELKEVPEEVRELLDLRSEARKSKDWLRADEIRTKINSLGYNVLDAESGQILSKI